MNLKSQHLTLAAEGWSKFSLVEQLANIGSEVNRAILARHNHLRYWGAISRALDLLYLTIADPRWRSCLKEIVRVRELLCEAALGGNEYNTTLEDLNDYFDYFAFLSRANR